MKVAVDRGKCMGHAQCAAASPDLYLLDDDGYNALAGETSVQAELEKQAVEGAARCPEGAIIVLER